MIFPQTSNRIFKHDLLYHFIIFIKNINILKILYDVQYFIFTYSSKTLFWTITFLCNIGQIVNFTLSQYLIYSKVEDLSLFSSFNYAIIFSLTLFAMMVKVIINFSNFIVIQDYYRYGGNLLKVDPLDSEAPTNSSNSNIQSTTKSSSYSIFSRHIHHHNTPPVTPRVSSWSKTSVLCAGCLVGLSAYSVYQLRLQTIATTRAADATVIGAKAAERSADVAEVGAGLMTETEFKNKWYPPSS